MAFGDLSPAHDVFPRIYAFTVEVNRALVDADTKLNPMSSLDLFGITRVKRNHVAVLTVPCLCFASRSYVHSIVDDFFVYFSAARQERGVLQPWFWK